MATPTHKRCPFCGAVGEIHTTSYGEHVQYRIECKSCGASPAAYYVETRADAWKQWDRRFGEGHQCSGCRWYVVGGAVDYCDLVHQKRRMDEFCSRWEKA